MTTESNSTPQRRTELLNIWISSIAVLVGVFALLLQQQRNMDSSLQEIRQLIQVSDSNRQAAEQAINARVDAAEQLVVATSPYRCPPIS